MTSTATTVTAGMITTTGPEISPSPTMRVSTTAMPIHHAIESSPQPAGVLNLVLSGYREEPRGAASSAARQCSPRRGCGEEGGAVWQRDCADRWDNGRAVTGWALSRGGHRPDERPDEAALAELDRVEIRWAERDDVTVQARVVQDVIGDVFLVVQHADLPPGGDQPVQGLRRGDVPPVVVEGQLGFDPVGVQDARPPPEQQRLALGQREDRDHRGERHDDHGP